MNCVWSRCLQDQRENRKLTLMSLDCSIAYRSGALTGFLQTLKIQYMYLQYDFDHSIIRNGVTLRIQNIVRRGICRLYSILFGDYFSLQLIGCDSLSEQKQNGLEFQSTLVIWKSKGPTKTLRDIRTSRYQICSIEEKTIQRTKFHK